MLGTGRFRETRGASQLAEQDEDQKDDDHQAEPILAAAFVLVVVATVVYAVRSIWRALTNPQPTAIEVGFAGAVAGGRHA